MSSNAIRTQFTGLWRDISQVESRDNVEKSVRKWVSENKETALDMLKYVQSFLESNTAPDFIENKEYFMKAASDIAKDIVDAMSSDADPPGRPTVPGSTVSGPTDYVPPPPPVRTAYLTSNTPIPYDATAEIKDAVRALIIGDGAGSNDLRHNLLKDYEMMKKKSRIEAAFPNTSEELLQFAFAPTSINSMLSRVLSRGAPEPGSNPDTLGDSRPPGWDGGRSFFNVCSFPVVGEVYGQEFAYMIPVYYTSQGLTDKHLGGRIPTYFPYVTTIYDQGTANAQHKININIDKDVLADENAIKALESAILTTVPANGSYISFGTTLPFKGASCGLAIALCLAGVTGVAATGFVRSNDYTTNDDIVENIEHIDKKIQLALDLGWPLLVPHSDVYDNRAYKAEARKYGNKTLTSTQLVNPVFTMSNPKSQLICLVSTLTEALICGPIMWGYFTSSVDNAAFLKQEKTIRENKAVWEAKRKGLISQYGVPKVSSFIDQLFKANEPIRRAIKYTGRNENVAEAKRRKKR